MTAQLFAESTQSGTLLTDMKIDFDIVATGR
jgi:hypothetical protein